jgi:hypothetical protein
MSDIRALDPLSERRLAAAAEKAADAAETFANAFARLVDIIGRLPAPGQGMWKK